MGSREYRPRIAVSIGDPNGIGPEVAIRCALDPALRRVMQPLLIGAPAVIEVHLHALGLSDVPITTIGDVGDWLLDARERESDVAVDPTIDTAVDTAVDTAAEPVGITLLDPDPGIEHPGAAFGQTSSIAGRLAMAAVDRAVTLCTAASVDAMVTSPISKEAISLAGYHDPGHTDFIARRTGAAAHTMMLVSGDLRVGLVTAHVPLREVASLITPTAIEEKVRVMHASLKRDFGIAHPHIAVLGLNPHAGDGGVLGREEIDVIAPTLNALRDRGYHVSGPHPADGLFASRAGRGVDAILAMYHDQGLAPFKALAFGTGVNFTAGLPIVRTSPDHGTAFDIAGSGTANPESMRAAILLAVDIVHRRKEALV